MKDNSNYKEELMSMRYVFKNKDVDIIPKQTFNKSFWENICYNIAVQIECEEILEYTRNNRNNVFDFFEKYYGINLPIYQKIIVCAEIQEIKIKKLFGIK